MPVYDIAAAAEALGVSAKELDNLVSRHAISGVERRRRGVTRKLPTEAVVIARIAFGLARDLGCPLASAVRTAHALWERDDPLAVSAFMTLSVDRAAVRVSTVTSLDDAVETVGRRPRGRPPRRTASPTAHTAPEKSRTGAR